tara:strand:- start:119 stop:430 length:312 start_codon:yes stop_codon:yes gene_type:complete
MILTNGATPIKWEIQVGGNGLKNFVGKVIARCDFGNHKYVVWTTYSTNGFHFDCEHGHYVNDYDEALRVYDNKIDLATSYEGRDELATELRIAINDCGVLLTE